MAFSQGSYATIWSVDPVQDKNYFRGRISTSQKDRDSGTYKQDFGSYVTFYGEAAKKVAGLKEKDRIRLDRVSVTNSYDAEKNVTYTNFNVFEVSLANEAASNTNTSASKPAPKQSRAVEEDSDELPF